MLVDNNLNRIWVCPSGRTVAGLPALIVRLWDEPSRGYIALKEEGGGFGNKECPYSYERPTMAWFGPGERHEGPEEALAEMPY